MDATRKGESFRPPANSTPQIVAQKAGFGELKDPKRTRNVRSKIQNLVDAGQYGFQVTLMAQSGDPAYGIVKTLIVD